ncbi:MAG: signal transduction histidine kinase with CheB and CheR, partial [Rhizobacter sp.]|nr:signal transduction histidine kinase with CheB and CheR [Rhizobacter sp.]
SKRQELARENMLLREQQASAIAKREVEMKDKFLAIMSHELKQPLNLIQVNAELLTRLPETREVASALRIGSTIQRAVASQTKIINDLLDLSRIRTGKLRLNFTDVSLDELVRSLAHAAEGDIVKKGLTLEVRSSERFDCRCDRTRIEQLIWNLVSNAIKFTPEGGDILVALQTDGQFVKIVVSDSGCGIDQRHLSRVFEMFNQLDVQLTPANGGLGIGLALVRELALAHGGSVDVASAGVDQGAAFTVWLPVVPSERLVSDETRPGPTVDFHGWDSLVVDDDFEAMDAFAALLRLEGATVNTASTPYIALELLETRDYGLILSDIGMPAMDGHEFIAEMRRRMLGKSAYSIALSGFGRSVDAERALLAGFDAHLAKPASVLQLRETVGRLTMTRELLAAIVTKEAGAQ